MPVSLRFLPLALALSLASIGCGGDDDQDATPSPTPEESPSPTPDTSPTPGGQLEVPDTYSFDSRFTDGSSSVAYAGQMFRHTLIADLKSHIGKLTSRIDSGTFIPAEGDVVAELDFFYQFDVTTSGDVEIGLSTNPELVQSTYADISSSGANLKGKIAGNDLEGQHEDWTQDFRGWNDGQVTTPESLVRHWFQQLEDLAIDRANGIVPVDPSGAPIASVHVTAEGHDLRELIQKFLDGAVAYSQGTDDYLDDDLSGKGLLSDNTAADGDKAYSPLEHQWDEGFGYFGAARDYNDYTDEEVSAAGGRDAYKAGYHDSDGDNAIDLLSEMNFGHSTNAAKRDMGSDPSAPTDFSATAFEAFLTGRAIITSADGALSEEQLADLKAQRDIAVANWEMAIASTVVHYINDVLKDMGTFGTETYSFANHAKHWSEMKGFALTLQFNPRSHLTDEAFVTLHDKLGLAPVLPGQDGADEYRAALLEARMMLADAYSFDAANVGDDNGENGW